MKQVLRLRPATSNFLRSIEKSQRRQFCGTRCLHNSPVKPQEQKEAEEKPSFRGQLYESTADRLSRERADQARYIKESDARNPNQGRTLGTSIGKHASIAAKLRP